MKYYLIFILCFLSCVLLRNDLYEAFTIAIFFLLSYRILVDSSRIFVFREWALLLYAINYLIAPLITYQIPEDQVVYGMKIPFDEYFNLALPGFLLFALGMYSLPTSVFKVDFNKINQASLVNQSFLVRITVIGLLTKLVSEFLPSEFAFFTYLLSMIRFVGAFALLSIDQKKWFWPGLVLIIELLISFINGAFHDALMWIVFFGLFYIYAHRPSLKIKITGLLAIIALVLFVQAIKFSYRDQVWTGDKSASIETVTEVGRSKASSDILLGEDNLIGTLNRSNQAWIFASTVNNIDTKKNFQGLTNVNKYIEAALLPRFLAPNKITSGNQEIFNEFSGHTVNSSTAMGLGIFADGYIAYGAWGVYIFGFLLGLIFALTFRLVERWTRVSPFYALLLLPLLNYAVRPDCELQTTINHLAKGIMLYGFLVYLTRKRFTLDSQENQRKLMHLNLATSKK